MKYFSLIFCIILFVITLTYSTEQKKDIKKSSKKVKNDNEIIYENFDMVFSYPTSNSVELTDSLKKYLIQVANYMKKNPNTIVRVLGHSDDLGTMDENQERSIKRAENVAKFLKSKGIKELRILVLGQGSLAPLASNKTEEGRKHNRRVEIRIIPSEKEFKKSK